MLPVPGPGLEAITVTATVPVTAAVCGLLILLFL